MSPIIYDQLATDYSSLIPFRLDGKTALITGAASGLGRATGELFASVGANVVIADFNLEGAKRTAEDISVTGSAIGVVVDVSDERSVQAAFAAAAAKFGGVIFLSITPPTVPKQQL